MVNVLQRATTCAVEFYKAHVSPPLKCMNPSYTLINPLIKRHNFALIKLLFSVELNIKKIHN